MTIDEVKKSTKKDSTLQKLVEVIRSGEWKSVDKKTDLDEAKVAELKLFSKVQHELTVDDEGSIIMRGLKIVLP